MAIKPLQTITLKNEGGEDITYTLSGEYPDLTAGAAEQIISDEYTENKAPYLLRASGGNGSKREDDTLVGGTVAWNQIFSNALASTTTTNGVTVSYADGVYSFSGTADADVSFVIVNLAPMIQNHVYLRPYSFGSASTYFLYGSNGVKRSYETPYVTKATNTQGTNYVGLKVFSGTNMTGVKLSINLFDLTQMFGSTIADYIYSLEQATTGAGVAWFKALFPADYYAYNAGELKSVEGVSAHLMKDADDNVVGNYPLDSSLTLRGIPKLDANNSLYYDGDTYESDGTVTRKYGIVDLGTLTWERSKQGSIWLLVSELITDMITGYGATTPRDSINVVGVPYEYKDTSLGWSNMVDKTFAFAGRSLRIRDDSYSTASAFKTAMSGVYIVYQLATPTTETADPFTNPQNVDPDGTEEYVTTSIVPVGHDTKYFANLVERLAAIPNPPTSNGTYRLIATVSGGVATLSWVSN